MEKNIFEIYSREEIDEKINHIFKMISQKKKDKDIIRRMDCEGSIELLSIVKARIRSKTDGLKDVGEELLYYNENDLRFSTPEIIADFRAENLRCGKIVDLCSGIGVQAGAFSRVCSEVLGIEIDFRKVRYCEENFIGYNNLKFICGDVLNKEVISKVKEFSPDLIFCDPERMVSEEMRNLESIKPNISKLILEYSKICSDICLEMPLRINLSKIDSLGNFEAEYLVIDKKLNRLNLLFGNLKKCDRSCVDVRSGVRLEDLTDVKKLDFVKNPMTYIYEVSEGIVVSGLVNELGLIIGGKLLEDSGKKVLLTSNEIYSGEYDCFINKYEFIRSFNKISSVNEFLVCERFGKAEIKYTIHPKEYWKERNKLESDLFGTKKAIIFCQEDKKGRKEFLVCIGVK